MILNTFFIPWTNLNFTKNLTINFEFAIKCLIYNIILEVASSYLNLISSKHKKDFVLTVLEKAISTFCNKIYGMNWNKISALNKSELPDKINRATMAIDNCLTYIINKLLDCFSLCGSAIIMYTISPVSLLIVFLTNILMYFFVIKKANEIQLIERKNIHKITEKFYNKYWDVLHNSIECVIHHQRDKIINTIGESKCDIERKWINYSYINDLLMFKNQVANNIVMLSCIIIYVNNNICSVNNLLFAQNSQLAIFNKENIMLVLTLQIYMSRLTDQLDQILSIYTNFTKWEKDYERIKLVLMECDERPNFSQITMNHCLTFSNVSFKYPATESRKGLGLESVGRFTFNKGETILVKGTSGAGKSTLYDIINGTIPSRELQNCEVYVDGTKTENMFHNLEKSRTMVLQDSYVSLRNTCFEIITGYQSNDKHTIVIEFQSRYCPKEIETFVWFLLKLVKLDDLFKDQFNGDIHVVLEDKISGGQKTRLLLARSLFRASDYCGASSILILDEPDRGLPADMTIEIIQNVIHWFKDKGILFLTLHTKEAQEIGFTHTILIENGIIRLV